ncbi:transporter, partial [Paeniglutamicibacter kerguelensis]
MGSQFLAWRFDAAALAAAVVCGVLAALMCLALARLTTTSMTRLTGSRRFRDVAGIIAIVPLILLGPIIGTVSGGFESALGWLPQVAEVLAWTPLGVFAAVPGDLASGTPLPGLLRFLLGLAYLGLVVWAWERSCTRPWRRRSPRPPAARPWAWVSSTSSATPTGAVAARALTYWLKDPRYAASIVIVPL